MTANRITIIPADLKNTPDLELFFMLNELKLTNIRTGSVPNANENIVKAPVQKFPVDNVYICMD